MGYGKGRPNLAKDLGFERGLGHALLRKCMLCSVGRVGPDPLDLQAIMERNKSKRTTAHQAPPSAARGCNRRQRGVVRWLCRRRLLRSPAGLVGRAASTAGLALAADGRTARSS